MDNWDEHGGIETVYIAVLMVLLALVIWTFTS